MKIDFTHPELVKRFGSWPRVQVAFYDFIFFTASEMCAKHWKEMALSEISEQFKDGGDLYERTVKGIEQTWKTPEEAWAAFLSDNTI